jgi:hypothetical protein
MGKKKKKKKKKANRYQGWLVCSKADTRPTLLITLKRVETIKPPESPEFSLIISVRYITDELHI